MGILDDILADGCFHSAAELTAAGVTEVDTKRASEEGRAVEYRKGLWLGVQGLVDNCAAGLDHASAVLLNPDSIICLFSATCWHGLCDDDPAYTWLAKQRGSVRRGWRDRVCGVSWSPAQMSVGLMRNEIAGVTYHITDPARTVVDVLRLRHIYGSEQSVRALHDYVAAGLDVAHLWHYAEALACLRQIEPFYRCAEEFGRSLPRQRLFGYNVSAEEL